MHVLPHAMKHFLHPAGLRRAAVAAAIVLLSPPAQGDVAAVVRYRSGNTDTILSRQAGTRGDAKASAKRGTASSKAEVKLDLPGISLYAPDKTFRGPRFKALAQGSNPLDTSPPAGKSDDRLSTIGEVRFGEVLQVLEAASVDLDFNIHGTVHATGADGAGFARAELQVSQSFVPAKSYAGDSTSPGYFDGKTYRVVILGLPVSFTNLVSYEAWLLTAANTSIYKQNTANADASSTVSLTGLTVRNTAGKRIETTDAMSKSGFDYSAILNPPRLPSDPETPEGPGEFSFASEAMTAHEDGGSLLVRVNRDGGSAGAASVVVRNVTVPPVDDLFVPFSTTLDFASGERQKFVHVKLVDDTAQTGLDEQGTRSFELELADATGAPLAATGTTATVKVYDDDVPWSAPDAGPQTLVARINPGGGVGETGLLTFTVTATGAGTFSGTLRGKTFFGTGTESQLNFIGGGKEVNIAGLGKVRFKLLRYKTSAGVPRLLGTATLPDTTVLPIRGVAVHTTDKTKPKTSKRGTYTLLLEPPPGGADDAPKGSGYATVKVLDNGKATLVGKLADGTALTAAGTLNLLAEWPLLLTLPSKRGELSGMLHFRFTPAESDIDGALRWTRPGSTVKGPHMAGFATPVQALGSRFVPPVSGEFLLPGVSSAVFKAEGPDIASTIVRPIAILAAPKHTITPSSTAEKLVVRLTATTGLWTGTFRDGIKTVTFQGAVLQSTRRAGGYFLGATQSGQVSLEPATVAP